jgi:hypothetical protein
VFGIATPSCASESVIVQRKEVIHSVLPSALVVKSCHGGDGATTVRDLEVCMSFIHGLRARGKELKSEHSHNLMLHDSVSDLFTNYCGLPLMQPEPFDRMIGDISPVPRISILLAKVIVGK